VLTLPLWVVKTRLALHRESSSTGLIGRVAFDMLRNEGPLSFFKGFLPSLFLSTYGIIQMYAYENINFILGYQSGMKMTTENFFIPFMTGGLSKSIASFTLMPINVVRLRL
jgi:hypothetical protein